MTQIGIRRMNRQRNLLEMKGYHSFVCEMPLTLEYEMSKQNVQHNIVIFFNLIVQLE